MNIKNSVLPLVLSAIDKMQTTDLNGAEIASIIRTKKAVQECADIAYQTQEAILKNHGIESANGIFTWAGHEHETEINSRLGELMKADSVITPPQPIEEANFYSSVKGLSINEIDSLTKIFLAQQ